MMACVLNNNMTRMLRVTAAIFCLAAARQKSIQSPLRLRLLALPVESERNLIMHIQM